MTTSDRVTVIFSIKEISLEINTQGGKLIV